ncbi:Cro/C1-type HTH DNA-binding domain-containing protein [Bacillus sp. OV166]|uniref:helix-turn-helix domain-containing protein n=1 Tax=Bacillus sp. OV166 TaxID=1882763 RepID=UPI000A2AC5E5|nr:helix-turn-helix domain-containing protein [Bacillus sp. OV166]SMQ77507.1 Cro/C1-type HTH DNA-binding domain-containing protein [Bacillus sp. OV166]
MSLLDIYLQKNEKKRYDVFKETGISQQMLSSVNNKSVSSYSVKTLQAIAKTLGKSEGTVLDELLRLENENPYFEVFNAEDLLLALKNKESYILIKGEYKKEMEELAKSQLSDTETLGLELGSAGLVTVLAEVILQLVDLFSSKDDDKKKIESQIRKYKFKKLNENEILLYLRQLDY